MWCRPGDLRPLTSLSQHQLMVPRASLATLTSAQRREFKAKFDDCGELARLGLSQFKKEMKKKNNTVFFSLLLLCKQI